MNDVVAVVLAAGRGTRMGKLTESCPKPLLPVLGRPALFWVLDGLIAAGIRRVVIVTGYLAEQIVAALDEYADRMDIRYVHQDEQKGTGHAMALTRKEVRQSPVLLAFADIMTSLENFSAMVRPFADGGCDVTAAVRDAGDPWRAAAVYMDDQGRITRIVEKPPVGTSTTPWSHAGMYCFSSEIYDYLERLQPSARGEYEITDAVQMMIADGKRCCGVELKGYWKDLAGPDDIVAAEAVMQAAGTI